MQARTPPRATEPGATTGQGQSRSTTASANVNANAETNLNAQQRARIHDVVIANRNIPRVTSINIAIRRNVIVPRSVQLVAVPEEIVRIFPRFRRHRVFIYGDEVVIVDPITFRIVAVLPA
jgi:hypothetical protein